MDTDNMLIGLVLLGFAYLIFHTMLAVYAAVALIAIWTVGAMQPKKADKKKDKFLEPIVIDSTRVAPYRIPDKMTLKYKPSEDPDAPKWADIQTKGVGGELARGIGRSLRKLFGLK